VKLVVVFKTWLNITVEDVHSTHAMLWTETVGWRFHCIPEYYDLGGSGEENASLAPHGADVLVGVGFGKRKNIG
jgi:hypothetical protein